MLIGYAELKSADEDWLKTQDCVDTVNLFLLNNRQQVRQNKYTCKDTCACENHIL